MSGQLSKVAELLARGESVALIGPSDSGKTYWVEHTLIPLLQDGRNVVYFRNGNVIWDQPGDIFIFDEVETLCDREFLEARHPEERPYYSSGYLAQVRAWQEAYRQFPGPALYVISRNDPVEIDNLIKHLTVADWDGRALVPVKFVR